MAGLEAYFDFIVAVGNTRLVSQKYIFFSDKILIYFISVLSKSDNHVSCEIVVFFMYAI